MRLWYMLLRQGNRSVQAVALGLSIKCVGVGHSFLTTE